MYVDIHAHLDDKAFIESLPQVLLRASRAGVKAIISNGTTPASNAAVKALCEAHPIIRPAYGMYPTETIEDEDAGFAWIKEQALGKLPPVAIGEVGLDGVTPVTEEQRIRFRKACALATELRLPIIIHSRKAEQDVYDELDAVRHPGPVVMHCFGGARKLVEEGVKRKYYFSVPCTITRATQFQLMVELVPLGQLLTETDAPYLSPTKEGFPNESANIVGTVELIAKIKKITVEECTQILFMNYQRLFS